MRVRSAPQLLVITDFDGTLVPIKELPSECFLDPAVGVVLSELARQDRVEVGIVSGRELNDLRTRVGLRGVVYAGNHGLEIEGPRFSFREPSAEGIVGELSDLVRALTPAISVTPGAWVEDKRLSLSVHYRQVDAAHIPSLLEIVRDVSGPFLDAGKVRVHPGRKVFELRPNVEWDKGKAVLWFAGRMTSPGGKQLIIYLGDDETDEDAFRALPAHITICVGDKPRTTAHYTLRDPQEVHWFLESLLDCVVDSRDRH